MWVWPVWVWPDHTCYYCLVQDDIVITGTTIFVNPFEEVDKEVWFATLIYKYHYLCLSLSLSLCLSLSISLFLFLTIPSFPLFLSASLSLSPSPSSCLSLPVSLPLFISQLNEEEQIEIQTQLEPTKEVWLIQMNSSHYYYYYYYYQIISDRPTKTYRKGIGKYIQPVSKATPTNSQSIAGCVITLLCY